VISRETSIRKLRSQRLTSVHTRSETLTGYRRRGFRLYGCPLRRLGGFSRKSSSYHWLTGLRRIAWGTVMFAEVSGASVNFKADTLDDLLRQVLEPLTTSTEWENATRGRFTELFGPVLHLTNPRARLSRSEMRGKVFSALGEWLWYLSGDNDYSFIDYYVPGRYADETADGKTVRSGYGERLFDFRGINQLKTVIKLLQERRSTRRAVIQLFDASDIERQYASIPCTCTLQFLVRDGRLNMLTNMRSNDAYFGLPHDVFAFTMIQEVVARSIGVELGEYKHCAGSLHLYEDQLSSAKAYLGEAWQATVPMPEMPAVYPWPSIQKIQGIEHALREGAELEVERTGLHPYWDDIARLLAAYRAARGRDIYRLRAIQASLHSATYKVFIESRIDKLEADSTTPSSKAEFN
jgi:thymidylate synthase